MLDYLHGPVAHEAFFKKYASKKFLKGKKFNSNPLATVIDNCYSINQMSQVGKGYVYCAG